MNIAGGSLHALGVRSPEIVAVPFYPTSLIEHTLLYLKIPRASIFFRYKTAFDPPPTDEHKLCAQMIGCDARAARSRG